jgi:hypothetical protein
MKRSSVQTLVPFALALAAASAFAADAGLLDDARAAAMSVPPRLVAALQEEIAKSGFDGAIDVCRDQAPQMAKEASEKTGWQIRRVSLKNRNPKAVPDAWEQAVLQDFNRRAAAGENPATLEKGEVVAEGGMKVYRYMKALPTQPLCLNCHGAPADLSPAVKARLAERYPNDKATGYAVGQIRGAMTLKRPL